MEADSTTYDNNNPKAIDEPHLPFSVCPGNYIFYKEFISDNGKKNLESQIVERLQSFGLLPKNVKCSTDRPECSVVCKPARVIDRVQWICEACGLRQPIRVGSFFFRLQCSILQVLQIVLAWCEDADINVAAEHFGVKPRMVSLIYERLDDLAVKEQAKVKLGGENSVVLAEMYPDCLNRLSPDTTDQPHVHRILMLADTNHIPTSYQLHLIKENAKKSLNDQSLKAQIEEVLSNVALPNSTIVTASNMPAIDGASSVQQLVQYCDADMQHFLTSRIWRQALSLCTASRDLCATTTPTICVTAVQRYLNTSLYRLRYGDGFYQHMLTVIAHEFTEKEA